ncbi:Gfo/Idh/MocA family protein [Croceivirga thetidis]|uniref:Gfo/Idh/MocA family oxidoreductase n=1 Tax=Croceivirga thetidis TaxID=2721623 RepID=A0ABX1GSR6_9FLAO|nr:Gfo/Idh/MocA family oxidoreductase [Croceivirga thetidis]NKI32050.1 Gfo/Idh/MocA family oxidoreductase [Croceivirga thetidis]
MVKIALIGAGKMGISHLSILGAHKDVEVVGVCDKSKLVIGALKSYSKFPCYTDFDKMLDEAKPDAVVVALPTKLHHIIVKKLLERNIHVFVEKPFCLTLEEGMELTQMANDRKVINQVGYHNKFIGTFNEVKNLLQNKAIGEIQHFLAEAYGPVVIKKKQDTWRSDPSQGGGCLLDYASHVIDLVNFLVGPIKGQKGTLLKTIYSKKVEDAVYSLLELENGITGNLSVNWSDETYRKMSTSITVQGSNGKIVSDANELKVYIKDPKKVKGYNKGWNVKYVTDLTPQVDFYLRGEEYSSQMDYFVRSIESGKPNEINNFQSAFHTDKVIAELRNANK